MDYLLLGHALLFADIDINLLNLLNLLFAKGRASFDESAGSNPELRKTCFNKVCCESRQEEGVPQWMIWHYSLANIEYVFGLPIQKTFKGAIFSELISFLNSADDHW